MRVSEIMTRHPACCAPDDCLASAAKIMLTHDCGSVPVVDAESRKVVGLLTDRDIAIRAIAAGRDPNKTCVKEVMSHPVATVEDEAAIEKCVKFMEENQIRRAPVVDHNGRLVGIVATADVARIASGEIAGELVKEISRGPDIGHSP